MFKLYLNGVKKQISNNYAAQKQTERRPGSPGLLKVEKVGKSQSGDLGQALVKLNHTRVEEDQMVGHRRLSAFAVWKKQPDGSWKIVIFRQKSHRALPEIPYPLEGC